MSVPDDGSVSVHAMLDITFAESAVSNGFDVNVCSVVMYLV